MSQGIGRQQQGGDKGGLRRESSYAPPSTVGLTRHGYHRTGEEYGEDYLSVAELAQTNRPKAPAQNVTQGTPSRTATGLGGRAQPWASAGQRGESTPSSGRDGRYAPHSRSTGSARPTSQHLPPPQQEPPSPVTSPITTPQTAPAGSVRERLAQEGQGSAVHRLREEASRGPAGSPDRRAGHPVPSDLTTTQQLTPKSLRERVLILERELRQREEAQNDLMRINEDLKRRLELFSTANAENVDTAEREMRDLRQRLSEAAELHRNLEKELNHARVEKAHVEAMFDRQRDEMKSLEERLKGELDSLKSNYSLKKEELEMVQSSKQKIEETVSSHEKERNEMASAVSELDEKVRHLESESDYYKAKADEYAEELTRMIEEKEKEKLADQLRESCLSKYLFSFHSKISLETHYRLLVRRFFFALRHASDRLRDMKRRAESVAVHHNQGLLTFFLRE